MDIKLTISKLSEANDSAEIFAVVRSLDMVSALAHRAQEVRVLGVS